MGGSVDDAAVAGRTISEAMRFGRTIGRSFQMDEGIA
jgi:hypothetical protein